MSLICYCSYTDDFVRVGHHWSVEARVRQFVELWLT